MIVGTVFIIGLFKSLRNKLASDCTRKGMRYKAVLADRGREGTLTLLPVGNDAKHALLAYADSLDDYEDGYVIVLPYAEIPSDLEDELQALADVGCKVVRATNGQDGWPRLKRRERPDTNTLNAAYARLWREFPVAETEEEASVSVYFRQLAETSGQILFADSVFGTCDAVAPHRREFMRRSADALLEFVRVGSDGRVDAYFRAKGIEHAQSGGINATFEAYFNGRRVYKETSNVHLKKGDNTTPEGAARLYYQIFVFNNSTYVVVLYAGPHPDRDVNWTYHFRE